MPSFCSICGAEVTWLAPEIHKCGGCNAVFRESVIDYQKTYTDKNYWFDLTTPEFEWVWVEQQNQANFIRRDVIPGNLVEFGAANGLIAQELAQLPQLDQLYIQELVDIRIDAVKKLYPKIDLVRGTFEDTIPFFLDCEIKNVVMNNVVEHIMDVNKTFAEVHSILDKGGRFIFVTDDGDNPFAVLPAMFAHPEHVVCLTRKAIEILCVKWCFVIKKYYRMTNNLIYVVLTAE